MGDGSKKCCTILKYGSYFAAFVAIFVTQLIILYRPEPKLNTEQFITQVAFPSFFRTLEEQNMYTNQSNKLHLPSACCNTNTTWLTPTTMTDVKGVVRTMAQFKRKKQFFMSDVCTKQNKYCPCKCAVERSLVSGIYIRTFIRIDSHHVGTFPVDSCCKCV